MTRSLESSVIRLLSLWSAEMPATIHRHEVFVGPPDNAREYAALRSKEPT